MKRVARQRRRVPPWTMRVRIFAGNDTLYADFKVPEDVAAKVSYVEWYVSPEGVAVRLCGEQTPDSFKAKRVAREWVRVHIPAEVVFALGLRPGKTYYFRMESTSGEDVYLLRPLGGEE